MNNEYISINKIKNDLNFISAIIKVNDNAYKVIYMGNTTKKEYLFITKNKSQIEEINKIRNYIINKNKYKKNDSHIKNFKLYKMQKNRKKIQKKQAKKRAVAIGLAVALGASGYVVSQSKSTQQSIYNGISNIVNPIFDRIERQQLEEEKNMMEKFVEMNPDNKSAREYLMNIENKLENYNNNNNKHIKH